MQHGMAYPVLIAGAIDDIFNQRMSQRVGMDADLVRPACHRLRFDQSRLWIPSNDPKARFGRFPIIVRAVGAQLQPRVLPSQARAKATVARILDTAADLLEEVAEIDCARLMAALHDAERARILTGPSGRRDISWRFTHLLTSQMLTTTIPQQRRQRLHLRVADAMTRRDHESPVYQSGIAHHLYCAGSLADPARTARALIAAR